MSYPRILLLEPPAVELTLDGRNYSERILQHQKYPQLLLIANLLSRGYPYECISFLDLKATSAPIVSPYREFKYGPHKAVASFVGLPMDHLARRIECFRPGIVGITANFTSERESVLHVAKLVRAVCAGCKIVVGGHDATTCPDSYLSKGVDYCAIGEAEMSLYLLLKHISEGSALPVGVCSRATRLFSRNPPRQPLSSVAYPAFGLLASNPGLEVPDGAAPKGVSAPFAVFETSRGCDEACSFCDSTFVVGRFRPIELPVLLNHASDLHASGVGSILFADDNLLYRTLPQYGGSTGRAELLAFFTHLRYLGMSWSFYNGIQLSLLESGNETDDEMIEALYGHTTRNGLLVGCYRAYLPLEKFWPQEMAYYHKLKPLDVEHRIVAAIASQQVPHLNIGFIIGNARETEESLLYSRQQAAVFGDLIAQASKGRSEPRYFPFCSVPIPGTPDARQFTKNIEYCADDFPCLYTNYASVIRSERFAPHEMTTLRRDLSQFLNQRTHESPGTGLEVHCQEAG